MYECDLEESVPIPAHDGKIYADVRERASAAVRAANLLVSEGYDGPEELPDDLRESAKEVLRAYANGANQVPKIADVTATPAGAVYLTSRLSEFDMQVVQDSARLRNYVTNKLILEAESPDARIRIKALELLGKISDVGLFTERTEVTINNRSTVELEDSLRDKIRKLMNTDNAEEATYVTEPVRLPTEFDIEAALNELDGK